MAVSEESDNFIELKGFMHTLIFSCYNPERDTQIGMMDLNSGQASALLDIEDIQALNRWSARIMEQHEAAQA